MPSFMIGSRNAIVYRLHGVGSILDDLARVGCCGWAAYEPPVHVAADQREQMLDVAGRAQEGQQQIRVVSALRLHSQADSACSLLAKIEVVIRRGWRGGLNDGG